MKRIGSITGFAVALLSGGIAVADTQVIVRNDTGFDIQVADRGLSGETISEKAWAAGDDAVPQGESRTVISFARAAKGNWMDPTPRFVAQGKSVVFTTEITLAGIEGAPLRLRQKLTGASKSTKMWFSVEGSAQAHDWRNDGTEYGGTWPVTAGDVVAFSYRAFQESGETHIEYVFSDPTE